ncbi:MAG: cell division protein SepF [Eggerthellaceae bacterium]|nr:cell division protein SepF [Eggerthellaceae bacterium]
MDLSDGKRMFGDIKSKLGFKGKADTGAYDEYYDDGYDDYGDGGYDDYGDDGYDPSYADGGSSSRYDSYGSVTTRRSGTRSTSSSLPRLVSIDDVRANTQVPSSLSRDPLPPRHVTRATSASTGSSYRSTRTMVDSSLPPEMTPEGTAATAAAASRRHSDGLDSLFSPTTDEPARLSVDSGLHARTSSSRGSYDPSDALSGSAGSSYSAKRSVVVVRPTDYGDAEAVAKALRAGDVAVLCLGATPEALAKRILDFSFGVAAALDANVECVADRTFAVTRFKELSDSERVGLHAQGVL